MIQEYIGWVFTPGNISIIRCFLSQYNVSVAFIEIDIDVCKSSIQSTYQLLRVGYVSLTVFKMLVRKIVLVFSQFPLEIMLVNLM